MATLIVGNVVTSSAGSQAGGDVGHSGVGGEIVQGALEGLERRLAEIDFVVLDLETTGGSPADGAITEIGAVRLTARAHVGAGPPAGAGAGPPAGADGAGPREPGPARAVREFSTLVNPGCAIPAHVAALTGISDALVATAPRAEDVLPLLIEFAAGTVLVAHNAPFDIGFLKVMCARHGLRWPALPTLDTAALARRVLTAGEVHDCRLGTLALYFGAMTPPTHRALDDARATAAVLHGLIGLLEQRGIHTLEELRGFATPSAPHQRRMRQLTATVPRAPGVCLFTGADGRVLHIMKSSDMQGRACGYFAAAETGAPLSVMLAKTTRIVPVTCATALEAEVAQIRLIAKHRPPYQDGWDGEHTDQPPQPSTLAAVREVVAARPRFSGGWDLAWIRGGMLEGTAVLRPGPVPVGGALPARGGGPPDPPGKLHEHVSWSAPEPGPADAVAAREAETGCLLAWLLSPGVRLIDVQGTWSSSVPRALTHSAGQTVSWPAPPR